MKPRRLDSETMVSRLATDGPGSSAGGVGLAAVIAVSSGRGRRTSCKLVVTAAVERSRRSTTRAAILARARVRGARAEGDSVEEQYPSRVADAWVLRR